MRIEPCVARRCGRASWIYMMELVSKEHTIRQFPPWNFFPMGVRPAINTLKPHPPQTDRQTDRRGERERESARAHESGERRTVCTSPKKFTSNKPFHISTSVSAAGPTGFNTPAFKTTQSNLPVRAIAWSTARRLVARSATLPCTTDRRAPPCVARSGESAVAVLMSTATTWEMEGWERSWCVRARPMPLPAPVRMLEWLALAGGDEGLEWEGEEKEEEKGRREVRREGRRGSRTSLCRKWMGMPFGSGLIGDEACMLMLGIVFLEGSK